MKILYLDWPCFGQVDVQFTLQQLGHEYVPFFHEDYTSRTSSAFDDAFAKFVGDDLYDCCFSFNYFPILSENCKKYGIKYIAAVYDSPQVFLYSHTLINPNNYVFLFDREDYLTFWRGGVRTVYYHPLPVNATIIDYLETKPYDRKKLSAEVSFVGSLYNEEHNFFDRLNGITDYTRGYLDAIMEAQLKVSGYNFIEEVLTKDVLDDMVRVYPWTVCEAESLSWLYAQYFINRKLTSIERIRLLTKVAGCANLKLFTLNKNTVIPNAVNMGTADYYSEMPYVFAHSKINLNITLRSIQSGIPLRAMDIMGNGGFLLTNYQSEFLDYFTPDEDFVYYEDEDDLVEKVHFYLEHEKRRKEIAQNGHEKVKKNHSFELFFQDLFRTVFPIK